MPDQKRTHIGLWKVFSLARLGIQTMLQPGNLLLTRMSGPLITRTGD
jgi:hypothetical protein